MWQVKHFRSFKAQCAWIDHNQHRFQITILFVNNRYAIEYRKLRVLA
jgi:hypothetical protein